MPQAAKCIAAALILGFAAAAQAQTVAPAGEPAPKAEAGTTAQSKCISEDDNYVRLGKGVGFRIELTNRCEQRITCKVFVYITSAKGPAQGRGTIVLAPKSTAS